MALQIPKKLHQIWVGSDPVPPRHEEWIAGWKRRHPDWEHRLWDEEALVRVLPDEALRYYHAAQSYAGKADVARIWIVNELGGVYVDTDFQCLRPIDELLHGCRAFVTFSRYEAKVINSIFGAVPRHPFLRALISDLPEHFDPEVANKAGPLLFREVVQDRSDVRRFEQEVFLPVTATDQYRLDIEDEKYWNDSYAVHHFEGNWARPDGKNGLFGTEVSPAKVRKKLERMVRPALQGRPFHAYCVGMEQTGMDALVDAFADTYRTRRVPPFQDLSELFLERKAENIEVDDLRRIFRERDRQHHLNLEANALLAPFCDILVELFPEAKFILPVRPPAEWLKRTIAWHYRDPRMAEPDGFTEAVLNHYYGPKTNHRSEVLREENLYPLDRYLRAWRRHHEAVLSAVPDDRLFVLRASEMEDQLGQLVMWLGIPADSLSLTGKGSDGAARTSGIVEEIDRGLMEERIEEHCSSLIENLRKSIELE